MDKTNILIVGPNSYIAHYFSKYTEKNYPYYNLSYASVRERGWKQINLQHIHTIVYFSAIVHHPEINDYSIYEEVNVTIPVQLSEMAKAQGVKQFIYISTVAIWGKGPKFGKRNTINSSTPICPASSYGKSKRQGELELMKRNSEQFTISIVRLPNVYGDNCPGTFYKRIIYLSHFPILPTYYIKQPFSLISVENVSIALCKIIEGQIPGISCPQDQNVMSVVERISELRRKRGKRQIQTTLFSPLLWCINKLYPNKFLNNLYGGFYIDTHSFPTII